MKGVAQDTLETGVRAHIQDIYVSFPQFMHTALPASEAKRLCVYAAEATQLRGNGAM